MADKAAQDQFSTGWQEAINAYTKGLSGASTAQTAFNSLTSSMETLFVNMANHATNAFQTFKNSVLQAIEQIAAKMVTSGILQALGLTGGGGGGGGILAMLAGAVGMGASGSAGASNTTGSPGAGIGGYLSDASSVNTLMGGPSLWSSVGSVFGESAGAFGAAAGAGFSAGISTLGIAATAGADAVGGMAVVIGAAIPVVGWIAAAAIIAYELFSKPGGGPKVGGSASVGDVSAVSELGTGNAGAGRFFTPNAGDAVLAQTVQGLQATYATALAALGGKGTAGFALGYDTDPLGTAQSRVSAGVAVGGKQVFQQQNLDVGRTDAELQTGLALEAQRVILAALKASDLPADIAKLFSSIDVPTASAAQITAIEHRAPPHVRAPRRGRRRRSREARTCRPVPSRAHGCRRRGHRSASASRCLRRPGEPRARRRGARPRSAGRARGRRPGTRAVRSAGWSQSWTIRCADRARASVSVLAL